MLYLIMGFGITLTGFLLLFYIDYWLPKRLAINIIKRVIIAAAAMNSTFRKPDMPNTLLS